MRAWSRLSARSGRGTGLTATTASTAASTATAGPSAGSMSTMLTAATTDRATGCAGAATRSAEPTRSVRTAASTAGAGLERSPPEVERELPDPEPEAEGRRGWSSALAVRRRCGDVSPAPSSSTSLVRLLPDEVEPKARGPETGGDGDDAGSSPRTDAEGRRESRPWLTLRRRRCDDRSPAPSSPVSLERLLPDEIEIKTRGPEAEDDCDGAGASSGTDTGARRAGGRGLALQMDPPGALRSIPRSPSDGAAAAGIVAALGNGRGDP